MPVAVVGLRHHEVVASGGGKASITPAWISCCLGCLGMCRTRTWRIRSLLGRGSQRRVPRAISTMQERAKPRKDCTRRSKRKRKQVRTVPVETVSDNQMESQRCPEAKGQVERLRQQRQTARLGRPWRCCSAMRLATARETGHPRSGDGPRKHTAQRERKFASSRLQLLQH